VKLEIFGKGESKVGLEPGTLIHIGEIYII
jgi:hypothetical protein